MGAAVVSNPKKRQWQNADFSQCHITHAEYAEWITVMLKVSVGQGLCDALQFWIYDATCLSAHPNRLTHTAMKGNKKIRRYMSASTYCQQFWSQ